MKSDPQRSAVRTSRPEDVPVSASFGIGCAVPARGGSDCRATATRELAASAVAPAAALFKNLRRPIDSFLDFSICVRLAPERSVFSPTGPSWRNLKSDADAPYEGRAVVSKLQRNGSLPESRDSARQSHIFRFLT